MSGCGSLNERRRNLWLCFRTRLVWIPSVIPTLVHTRTFPASAVFGESVSRSTRRCEKTSLPSVENAHDPLATSGRSQRVRHSGFALHVGQNAIAAGILGFVKRPVAALD